jgi:hypothetical protein
LPAWPSSITAAPFIAAFYRRLAQSSPLGYHRRRGVAPRCLLAHKILSLQGRAPTASVPLTSETLPSTVMTLVRVPPVGTVAPPLDPMQPPPSPPPLLAVPKFLFLILRGMEWSQFAQKVGLF